MVVYTVNKVAYRKHQGSLHCKQGTLLVNTRASLHCKQGTKFIGNIIYNLCCKILQLPVSIINKGEVRWFMLRLGRPGLFPDANDINIYLASFRGLPASSF